MALTDLLIRGSSVAVVFFVVSSTLGVGLSLTVGQILARLKNARLAVLSLAANFVLAPLVALGLWRVLDLDEPLGIGLLLCGLAAGAPFLIKLAEFAKADLAFAVGLMVLLMVVTVGYLPLALPLFLDRGDHGQPGEDRAVARRADAHPAGCGSPGSGPPPRHGVPHPTHGWVDLQHQHDPRGGVDRGWPLQECPVCIRYLRRPGRCCLYGGLRRYWVAPRRTRNEHSGVLALGTAQRNSAAAFVVAGQNFEDAKVIVMITVVLIVDFLMLLPFARILARGR